MPSGWKPEWHCGVRAGNAGKLVAFIAAVPAKIRVYDKTVQMVEINFLCVHKKLRSKRLAPVLIREITRRVNQNGIFQATFTAGIIIPKPVGTCRLINIFLYFFFKHSGIGIDRWTRKSWLNPNSPTSARTWHFTAPSSFTASLRLVDGVKTKSFFRTPNIR